MQQGILEGKKEDIVNLFIKAKLTTQQIAKYLNLELRFVVDTLKEKKLV